MTFWDSVRDWFHNRGPTLPVPVCIVPCACCKADHIAKMVDERPSWQRPTAFQSKEDPLYRPPIWSKPKRSICAACRELGRTVPR